MKLVLASTAAVLLACVMLYLGYVDVFGYKASRVEADLCEGRWMVYQETDGFTNPLRCLGTPRSLPLPARFKPYEVSPDTKFTLSDMDELCGGPRSEPQDVGGILRCIEPPKSRFAR